MMNNIISNMNSCTQSSSTTNNSKKRKIETNNNPKTPKKTKVNNTSELKANLPVSPPITPTTESIPITPTTESITNFYVVAKLENIIKKITNLEEFLKRQQLTEIMNYALTNNESIEKSFAKLLSSFEKLNTIIQEKSSIVEYLINFLNEPVVQQKIGNTIDSNGNFLGAQTNNYNVVPDFVRKTEVEDYLDYQDKLFSNSSDVGVENLIGDVNDFGVNSNIFL
jgi:predicted component of type VI protein secretion system